MTLFKRHCFLFTLVVLIFSGENSSLVHAQQLSTEQLSAQQLSAHKEQEAVQNLLYGYLLAANGEYVDAATIIGDIGIEQQNSEILSSAVKLAIQAGEIALAQHYVDAWVAYGGGTVARQNQAELLLLQGKLEQAEKLLAGLMIDQVQTSTELMQQLSIVEDKEQAVAIGQRLFPKEVSGRYHLALLAYVNGVLPVAQNVINESLAAGDDRLEVLFLAARIAQLQEGDNAPLAIMEKYVEEGCNARIQHCSLDAVLWAFSYYLRNEQQWREGLTTAAAMPSVWAVSAGNWFEQWEMPARAQAAYQRAGEVFSAQMGLARLAEDRGDTAGALAILKQGRVSNSEELATREARISYLLDIEGDLDAALMRIIEAQKTLPNNFSLMYHHSLLLEKRGEIAAAVAVLQRMTQLFPDNPNSWNALGYVMADHFIELPTAKKYIERALQFTPNDPNMIDSLGWVNYRLGDLETARAQLQKAVELSTSVEIYTHYGEVLWELGAFEAAKDIWQQAEKIDPDNQLLLETFSRYPPF